MLCSYIDKYPRFLLPSTPLKASWTKSPRQTIRRKENSCRAGGNQRSMTDLDAFKFTAVNAAKEAGQHIVAAFTRDKNVELKGAVDLVTETDKQCEQIIYQALHSEYPEHKFIGEEGSAGQGFTDELTDAPTWMVDPVDGTTNFVHGYPHCCVSIGLAIKKKVVLGVVFNPVLDELYVGVKGQGSTLNGRRIQVSETKILLAALFGTEIGVSRDTRTVDAVFARIRALCQKTRSVRSCGSCALDLAYVACGRYDFMYEIGFGGCWDCAAGSIIVEEAGGQLLDPNGGQFNVMARRVLAGNKHVTKLAAEIIAQQPLGPTEPGIPS